MKNLCKVSVFLIIILLVPVIANSQDQALPKAELPLLVTSAGQGPGGEIVHVLARRNKIENRLVNAATLQHLPDSGTLIIALSSSLKGMGVAGVSIDQELARLNILITEAKKRNILIIGTHLEGEARRGGYDEVIIEKIASQVSYLIVRRDGNTDGMFDKLSKAHQIPLFIIEKTLDFSDLLVKMFIP